jgi:hypothetical protein
MTAATDAQIDRLVYDLHGLTEAEKVLRKFTGDQIFSQAYDCESSEG